MKHLYESILSSTNSGKQKYINDCIEWFRNTVAGRQCNSPDMKIDVDFENGEYKINVTNARRSMINIITFSDKDLEQNEFLFKIAELNITLAGKIEQLDYTCTYINLNFESTRQMIKNAKKFEFVNCTVHDFDGNYLSKNIDIKFSTNQFHKNFGQSYIDSFHNVDMNFLKNERHIYATGCTYGMHCKLSNITNCSIKTSFISLTENMFDTENVIDYENNCLTKEASKELNLFLKKNNIDLKIIFFRSNEKRGFPNTKYAAKLLKNEDIYTLKYTMVR